MRNRKNSYGLANRLVWIALFLFALLSVSVTVPDSYAADNLEMPSSWNPVGSGARALGLGAFIAVADDATAASWNPGGLTQLEEPEASVVLFAFKRTEESTFSTNPEANGRNSVREDNLNYFSLAYPFSLFDYSMVVSLNYQHLFDFNRKMNLSLDESSSSFSQFRTIDERHTGELSATGLAYAVRLAPSFSLGITVNLWNDLFGDNGWKTSYRSTVESQIIGLPGSPSTTTIERETQYDFSGVNCNLGFLWNVSPELTVGGVVKTPFEADVTKATWTWVSTSVKSGGAVISDNTKEMVMEMPTSVGVGGAYRFSDKLTASIDVVTTLWQDFTQTDANGKTVSPITNLPLEESDIEPTYQVRVGAEYLVYRPKNIIPLRAGIFYDPAPAPNRPDIYYGFSLGTGAIFNDCVVDVAYKYRIGHQVGGAIHQVFGFAQDVAEHTVYTSVVYYFR